MRTAVHLLVVASAAAARLDAFFAPYDGSTALRGHNVSALQTDLELIETVTKAAAHGNASIYFCVYNLLDPSYVQPLIAAAKAGVTVQVLMDAKNLQKPYVHTYDWFKDASLKVAPTRSTTQRDLSPDARRSLNLLGIKMTGLMHMKLRAFSWLASPTAHNVTRVVVSGSLNPEDGALHNEDTLIVVRDEPTIDAYMRAYYAVRDDDYQCVRCVRRHKPSLLARGAATRSARCYSI